IIIFDDLGDAEDANEGIKKIRKELKLPENFEFKFSTGTSNKSESTKWRWGRGTPVREEYPA
ncbi:MAG: hypothetical protein KKG00_08790, partial [Bacteroidetes bacterium]|nr:hypothetical protein [Bacteroidota bacterium]